MLLGTSLYYALLSTETTRPLKFIRSYFVKLAWERLLRGKAGAEREEAVKRIRRTEELCASGQIRLYKISELKVSPNNGAAHETPDIRSALRTLA